MRMKTIINIIILAFVISACTNEPIEPDKPNPENVNPSISCLPEGECRPVRMEHNGQIITIEYLEDKVEFYENDILVRYYELENCLSKRLYVIINGVAELHREYEFQNGNIVKQTEYATGDKDSQSFPRITNFEYLDDKIIESSSTGKIYYYIDNGNITRIEVYHSNNELFTASDYYFGNMKNFRRYLPFSSLFEKYNKNNIIGNNPEDKDHGKYNEYGYPFRIVSSSDEATIEYECN